MPADSRGCAPYLAEPVICSLNGSAHSLEKCWPPGTHSDSFGCLLLRDLGITIA